jgi:uncharacterized protein (UPF0332 family)
MSLSAEVSASLERSEASLRSARVLLEADLFDDSASRPYYAAFHGASAVLLAEGLSFGSHTGVLRAISLSFVKTGRLAREFGQNLNWLAELRQLGDYGDVRHVAKEEAMRALQVSEADEDKADLKARGAIFEDTPGDRASTLSPTPVRR